MPDKRKSNPSANSTPLILMGSGLILVISILLWQALASTPQNPSTSSNSNAGIPYSNVQRVSASDAKAALDGKIAVLVDVRDLEIFNASHIPGAVSIPLGVFETQYRQLDPNQWIITYCT